ncbi:recombinase family protein [Citricoccus sp. GCM10030269]|uniref:recombinase family protein n=1 Tax=Citricoccus sp. GCM10030269 TaxID=3273388 RepID=UPI0036143853
MASLGYARVSTLEQNADLQIRALEGAGCLRVYTDHGVSGTQARRPELEKLLDSARPGDELVVWKLDRLGRNTRRLLDLVDSLESRGIHFRSLTEGIVTTGPMGKAMLTVMSAFAQLERDQLAERTRAGLAAAAARGRKGGRPAITPETEKVRQASQYRHAGLTPPEIAKLLGVSRATVYRYLALLADEVNG